MDYNTERAKLKIPEYGRTIQQMVDYAVTIADRQERNHCAHTIIQIMGTMFPAPGQKDPQQNTTLWDQLAIMSDFKLDIDWPFPITSAEELQTRPTPLHYPQTPIRLRHYGRLVENFLDKLKELEPDEDRNAAIVQVADQMMRDLAEWNQDAMEADRVADDIARLTDGMLQVPSEVITAPVLAPKATQSGKRKRRKK